MLLVLIVALLTGCSGVVINKPFGTSLPIKELKKLQGQWAGLNSAVQVAAGNGKLVVGGLDYEDNRSQFVAINTEVVITDFAGKNFVFVKMPSMNFYSIALIADSSKDIVTLRMPDEKAFHALVDDGSLKGRVPNAISVLQNPVVELEMIEDQFERVMKDDVIERLFPKSNVVVLSRSDPPKGSLFDVSK